MIITFLISIIGVLLVVLSGLAFNLSLYKSGGLQSQRVRRIERISPLHDAIFQHN